MLRYDHIPKILKISKKKSSSRPSKLQYYIYGLGQRLFYLNFNLIQYMAMKTRRLLHCQVCVCVCVCVCRLSTGQCLTLSTMEHDQILVVSMDDVSTILQDWMHQSYVSCLLYVLRTKKGNFQLILLTCLFHLKSSIFIFTSYLFLSIFWCTCRFLVLISNAKIVYKP